MESKQRWQDWVNLILGVWLFIVPFFGLVALTSMPAWNGYVFGVIIAVLSVWALVRPRAWEEWINLVIGVWLIVAPFILGYYTTDTAIMWNHIVVGIIVGADALWAALVTPRHIQHA